ncbi:MAG: prepilin peptidase [Candidatus Eremiobacteraeota bacterium]|nr:prepilin peptidase [Candidatus Eremiobacteraeota bacterium]
MTALFAIVAAFVGLCFGSFLNVIIHRLPQDRSVAYPGSACPACGHTLAAWENIPVVSWLILRGRCHGCGAPISARYVLVELMTAALFALAVLVFGVSLQALGAAVLSAYLVATVFIDIDHLLIVDALTLPVAVAGLVLALLEGRGLTALAGALLGAVIFGAIHYVTRGTGLGLGDVKLAACLGLFLGLHNALAAFAASFVLGTIIALPVLIVRKRRQRDVLPFGPFLVLGALLMTFAPGFIYGPYAQYQTFVYRHLGAP